MHVRRLLLMSFLMIMALQACDALPGASPDPGDVQPTEPEGTPGIDDAAILKAAISAETGIPADRLEFTIDVNTGTHAKGSLGEVNSGERGSYLAAKVGAGWVIVYAGYSLPLCEDLVLFRFPAEVASECLDRSIAGYPTILEALLAKTGIPEESLSFVIDVNTGSHVKGKILPAEEVELSTFLAASVQAGWLVVFNGPAEPLCSEIALYEFPMDVVPECIDSDGTLLNRAAADLPGIEAALVTKTGIAAENLNFTIGINTGTHAWGNVSQVGETGGGYYLAVKNEGIWIIAYDGQATPFCSDVDPYFFPSTMVPTCSAADLSEVDRTAYDRLGIEAALAERTGLAADQLDVTIDLNTGAHASGSFMQVGATSGAHYLAVILDGTWTVVFEGQDAPFCSDIEVYNFPVEIVPFCLAE
jgi:hypothetical protein